MILKIFSLLVKVLLIAFHLVHQLLLIPLSSINDGILYELFIGLSVPDMLMRLHELWVILYKLGPQIIYSLLSIIVIVLISRSQPTLIRLVILVFWINLIEFSQQILFKLTSYHFSLSFDMIAMSKREEIIGMTQFSLSFNEVLDLLLVFSRVYILLKFVLFALDFSHSIFIVLDQ